MFLEEFPSQNPGEKLREVGSIYMYVIKFSQVIILSHMAIFS